MKTLALVSLLCRLLAAQPSFDAASVKPTDPSSTGRNFMFNNAGDIDVKNGTLKGIIEMAYDVRGFQIIGGPGWLDSDRYDVIAKNNSDESAASSLSKERIKQSRVKLQTLLADRFKLKVRRETRQLPIYDLVLAKNGSKLAESAPLGENATNRGSGIRSNCGQLTGTRATLEVLAMVLSRYLDRPVIDRTGLPAKYDFQLEFTPESGPCAPGSETLNAKPAIFTALTEQIGLRLESSKGPVDVIVVERASKPDAN